MTFEDLLNRLEDLVCDVVDRVLKSPAASLVYDLNPVRPLAHIIQLFCVEPVGLTFVKMFLLQDFKPPKRPFKRMNYTEAIDWLREHDVKKDDGTYYEFGEVISLESFLFLHSNRFCRLSNLLN